MGRIVRSAAAFSVFGMLVSIAIAVPINHPARALTGLVLPENTDVTFANSSPSPGSMTVPLPTGDTGSISSILPQPDDSLIVGGELDSATAPLGFWLAHLGSDGSLDPVFGTGGVVTVQTWAVPNPATTVNPPTIVQAGGRIIVASDSDSGAERLYGLTATGATDATFGGGGNGVVDFPGFLSANGTRVLVDSQQRVYVVAIDSQLPSHGFAVIRLSTGGTPDPAYPAGGGSKFLPSNGSRPTSEQATFTPDDRLVVLFDGGGTLPVQGLTLVRLLADGSSDPTFATNFGGVRPLLLGTRPTALHVTIDGLLLFSFGTPSPSTPGGFVGSTELFAADGNTGNGLQHNTFVSTVVPTPGGRAIDVESPPTESAGGPLDVVVRGYRRNPTLTDDPTFNPTGPTPGVARIPATSPPILITRGATDALGTLVLGGEIRTGSLHGTPWLTRMLTGPKPFAVNSPSRLVDTRRGAVTVDGLYAGIGAIQLSGTLAVRVTGRGKVAPDATAVVLNVTVVNPKADGFITVYPCTLFVPTPAHPPTSSNLNYKAGQTISNAVITKIGFDPFLGYGLVCFHTLRTTDLVVDGGNYFPPTSTFQGLDPARLMDTRRGQPTVDGQYAGIGIRPAGSVTELQVAGRGGVPIGATAAVLNVTSTESTAPGFVTAFPCDVPQPNSSNVNFSTGSTIPNLVITKLSASGTVCLYTHAPTQLVVDATGAFAHPGTYLPLVPARLLESRANSTTIDGRFNDIGIRDAGTITELQVAGRAGVPLGVSAAVLNITTTESTGPGFVTVYPCDPTLPNASNVNFVAGQTIPNSVVAQLTPRGTVCIYTHAATHLLVDVSGYFPYG